MPTRRPTALAAAAIACALMPVSPPALATCAPVKFQLVNHRAEPLRVERIELRGAGGVLWTLAMRDLELAAETIHTTNKVSVGAVQAGERARVRVLFYRPDGRSVVASEIVETVCERNITVRLPLR